jgi:hypothetical protein
MAALRTILISAELFVIVGFLGKYIVSLLRDRRKDLDLSETIKEQEVLQKY